MTIKCNSKQSRKCLDINYLTDMHTQIIKFVIYVPIDGNIKVLAGTYVLSLSLNHLQCPNVIVLVWPANLLLNLDSNWKKIT